MTISDLVFIDSTGYHYADFPSFLTFIQDQYKNIYGEDVYLGADSQDGQFLAVLAQSFFDVAALGASTYSSFSPLTAQGVGLSRVVKINGISRRIATHSTAELVIVGVAFTTITNGIAIDLLNQKWAIPTTTIPFSGTITVTATAVDEGALQALPNTINSIFTPTQGWQTVNNPAAATAGQPVETDAQLRARQSVSVANPSLTVFEGTIGAVENVTGVVQVKGYENPTGTTDANGLPPHSISVVVEGGLDTDVAQAIQVHKTPGTQTYGTTTVLVDDSHGMPININFYRPTVATIHVQIPIHPLTSWVSSNEDIIAAAMSAYITSLPIGADIVVTQLYAIAYVMGTTAQGSFNIEGDIQIKKNSGSFASTDIQLLFNEIAFCPATNVSFVIV